MTRASRLTDRPRRRLFGGAAALVLGLLPIALGAQAGNSQTPGASPPRTVRTSASSVPRTPEGRPDLQGTWNYSSLTPLERPAEFADRATLTPAEAAKYVRQVMERNNADRRDGGVDADVARAYNDLWYDRGSQVAVVDGRARTSLIVEPPDGRLPALTSDAQGKQAARAQARRDRPADGPEDRSLTERCLGFNAGPPMLPGPYNNYVQIFPFKDSVVVFNEMIHDARVIPTDGRPHLPSTIKRYLGDSVGRWEGDTLVVDTTNFTDRTNFRGATDAMHLVERFTRVDANTLLYEFTVTDPAAFTKPWSVALPMSRTDEAVYEYACHEANEAMIGILRGARFGERTRP